MAKASLRVARLEKLRGNFKQLASLSDEQLWRVILRQTNPADICAIIGRSAAKATELTSADQERLLAFFWTATGKVTP